MFRSATIASFASLFLIATLAAQDRDTKVRNDRKELEDDDNWVYDNLPEGMALAKRENKPLLIVFR